MQEESIILTDHIVSFWFAVIARVSKVVLLGYEEPPFFAPFYDCQLLLVLIPHVHDRDLVG